MQTYRSRTPVYAAQDYHRSDDGEIAAHGMPDLTVGCRSETLRTHCVATKDAARVS